MAFKPVLFVGCGGSGGVTLMYLMDALRTELNRALELEQRISGVTVDLGQRGLPSAWQFVHVDVPAQPDGASASRPPTVPEQGGRYVGIAPPGLSYGQVATSVWNAAGEKRPDLMSGWMRVPGAGDPDLTFGAGQERAVGRAATLKDLSHLKDQLAAALSEVSSAGASAQLNELGSALGSTVGNTPVLFVVSSMSGGSGASMVLDIAQVLSRINPNLAATASLFLYTSEVFSSLTPANRMGVEPNGLAALGELVATSLGANRDDGELFQELGVNGTDVSRPFRRVFPIGSKHGQNQANFGDGSMETIYRAVGRALAALVSAPGALDQFIDYDVTNKQPTPTDLQWLGEGSASEEAIQWGSFGYARLSLGRDRYGEYVAQRFAREALDRLVAGHMRRPEGAGEAQLRQVSEDAHSRLIRKLNLPGPTEPADVARFLGRGSTSEAKSRLTSEVRAMLDHELLGDPNLGMPLPGDRFLQIVRQLIATRNAPIKSAAQVIGYRNAHAWQRQFVTDLLLELEDIVARDGLSVARQVVVRLKDDADVWTTQLRQQARMFAGSSALEPPGEDAQPLQGNGMVTPDHPARQRLLSGVVDRCVWSAAQAAASLVADALSDFGPGFAEPLAQALQGEQAELIAERERPANEYTRTELRTPLYAEWPSPGKRVPPRFSGSHNEVLLMDISEFAGQFDAHLNAVARAAGATTADSSTLDDVLQQILCDRWPGHRERRVEPRSTVIQMSSPWTPPQLTEDPGDRTIIRSRSAARFTLAYSPADVVERARHWVNRQDGEYRDYLSLDLGEYVASSALTDDDRRHRRSRLVAKFGETLQQALPLVQVDPAAFGVIHRGRTPVEQFKFSAVPFESDEVAADALKEELLRRSAPEDTVQRFQRAISGSKTSFIDVFSSYPPMSMLAFPSLLKPLNDAWLKSVASQHTDFFWTNRRARALPGCLPLSHAERRAMLAGYVVGKVTGRLRGTYAHEPHEPIRPIEVYDEGTRRWLAFPSPLLSPFLQGFAADEYAALLESQLLAMAACGHDSSMAPLRPYVALRRLFGTVIQAPQAELRVDDEGRGYDTAPGQQYLRQWIFGNHRPPDAGTLGPERTATKLGMSLTDAEARREATLQYLRDNRENRARVYNTDDPMRNPALRQFDRRPLAATLAVDFVWALDEVIRIVESLTEGHTTVGLTETEEEM